MYIKQLLSFLVIAVVFNLLFVSQAFATSGIVTIPSEYSGRGSQYAGLLWRPHEYVSSPYIDPVHYFSCDNSNITLTGVLYSFVDDSVAASGMTSNVGCDGWMIIQYGDIGNNFQNNTPYYFIITDPTTGQTWQTPCFQDTGDDDNLVACLTNNPPSIQAISDSMLNQGTTYISTGSFNDLDSTSWTATVDYGDGSGSQQLTLNDSNFSLNHQYNTVGTYTVTVDVTDNQNATGTVTAMVTVQRQLVSLSPAKIWVGLKNSDDVGIKLDLKAEVYKNTTLVSSGTINSVAAGSSGFNNAKLDTIPFNTFSPVDFPYGSQLKMTLYVRNACTGSGHNSGTARLWYNDTQANSQFGSTIGNTIATDYLLDNFILGTSAGPGSKKTIDIAAGAKCSPYKTFGTWTIAP